VATFSPNYFPPCAVLLLFSSPSFPSLPHERPIRLALSAFFFFSAVSCTLCLSPLLICPSLYHSLNELELSYLPQRRHRLPPLKHRGATCIVWRAMELAHNGGGRPPDVCVRARVCAQSRGPPPPLFWADKDPNLSPRVQLLTGWVQFVCAHMFASMCVCVCVCACACLRFWLKLCLLKEVGWQGVADQKVAICLAPNKFKKGTFAKEKSAIFQIQLSSALVSTGEWWRKKKRSWVKEGITTSKTNIFLQVCFLRH